MEPLEAQPPKRPPPRLGSGTVKARSLKLCQAVVLPSVTLQAMVPPNNGSGIANTPKIQDETLFDSIFEVIGSYTYSNLSYMKEQ